MRVGFTGTRDGMTQAQKEQVHDLLVTLEATWLHHGDCVGADAEAHAIARAHGCRIYLHPPADPKLRAFCDFDESSHPKPYLVRNRDIVYCASFLIGTPGRRGKQTGGTWYTIGHADDQGRQLVIVYPSGKLEWRNCDGGIVEFMDRK